MYRPEYCAGIDEVGRGPLAGPVYAAAVVLDPLIDIVGLKDSKVLTVKKREELNTIICAEAVDYAIGRADVEEIDSINILQASLSAMQRAASNLCVPLDFALVDGNTAPRLSCPSDYLVKGDSKFDAIKAASIIAKVARDKEMLELDSIYPGYGFAKHKGYPTPAHLEALKTLGPSPIHRMSFSPCKQMLD
ncbi:MAG: ribonuclease HII [Candidatus Azotimanducaceae bacterium]|uniref:Ribonuclease HII n=1 Tax=OM182 bacterium TaxID=2510334 RepID=A0A520S442_9GAMM|nr:ribonuclease HII [Gammaproteobacteria bacterium]OUV67983.1 MAG: ribonuclease HII [Gammaproteobacteria bacterium TMED133]RZO77247.1 MAG: ribonuclease HII [OM182 bacterium]